MAAALHVLPRSALRGAPFRCPSIPFQMTEIRARPSLVRFSSPLQTARQRRLKSTSVIAGVQEHSPPPATGRQLRAYFWTCAIPMLGFGFMDNTVMIQAGNYIDCTIGVTLGLSTLAAAACGQIVSSGGSILFGDTVERIARAAGLPSSGLSSAQRRLPTVRRVGLAGSFLGVVIGAALGLVNLLFIDTKHSAMLKLDALTKEQEFEFEIEVSNSKRRDATTVTVRGPDVDGVLASLTAALTQWGCSLVEMHASPRSKYDSSNTMIHDVFVVRPRIKGKVQMDDSDLEDLGKAMLAACKDPLSAHTLKTQVKELEETNLILMDRITTLEKVVDEHQITVEKSSANQEDENGSEQEHTVVKAM